jgi:hypothetical protein
MFLPYYFNQSKLHQIIVYHKTKKSQGENAHSGKKEVKKNFVGARFSRSQRLIKMGITICS